MWPGQATRDAEPLLLVQVLCRAIPVAHLASMTTAATAWKMEAWYPIMLELICETCVRVAPRRSWL